MKQSHEWWQERSKAYLAECARLVEAEIGGGAVEAIFLCGSFAAGEESIVLEQDVPILLSDIDLVVIVKSSEALIEWFPRRAELGSACEASLTELRFSGHVEIGIMLADDLRRLPARPGVYDMKKKGRVLSGNAGILNYVPAYSAGSIIAREALVLIENRVISVLDRCPECWRPRDDEPYRFLYGIARAYTDIATAALSIAGCYVPGYVVRRDLLRQKIEGEKHPLLTTFIPPDMLSKIDRSTNFKVDPKVSEGGVSFDAVSRGEVWTEAARDILFFWRQAMTRFRAPHADLSRPLPVGSLVATVRNYDDWRAHAISWRSFLRMFSLSRGIVLAASLGADLLRTSPLDMVHEEGLRLLDSRCTLGPGTAVRSGRFGFPHHGGPWEKAAAELSSLWGELVFGRKGA